MQNSTNTKKNLREYVDARRLVFTAMLAAVAAVLQMLSFKLPFMPSFISFDLSDFPAVMASLTMGSKSGIFVCLVKNIICLFTTKTGGVGELSNFILGCALVIPAGIIGRKINNYKGAVIGSVIGSFIMGLLGLASNYFLVYPIYEKIMPIEVIIGMYQAINPSVNGLFECLLIFNLPFTIAKGLIASLLTLPLYKKLRPVFNSYYRQK